MSDIQRYEDEIFLKLLNKHGVKLNLGSVHNIKCQYGQLLHAFYEQQQDQIKAIEAKDKEIESLKGQLKDCRCLLEYKRDDIRIRDEDIGNLADEVRRFKKIAHLCSDMVALSPAPKKGYAHIEELAELQNKINELTK